MSQIRELTSFAKAIEKSRKALLKRKHPSFQETCNMGLETEDLHENVLLQRDIVPSSPKYGEINPNIQQGHRESSLRGCVRGARGSTHGRTRQRNAPVGFAVPRLD
jgi:hypothetical protein